MGSLWALCLGGSGVAGYRERGLVPSPSFPTGVCWLALLQDQGLPAQPSVGRQGALRSRSGPSPSGQRGRKPGFLREPLCS